MKVAALKCPVCEEVIWSKTRHDFRNCACKRCAIDGGRAYTKVSHDPDIRPIIGVLDTRTNQFSTDDEEELFQ
jgi:hypothetical protein